VADCDAVFRSGNGETDSDGVKVGLSETLHVRFIETEEDREAGTESVRVASGSADGVREESRVTLAVDVPRERLADVVRAALRVFDGEAVADSEEAGVVVLTAAAGGWTISALDDTSATSVSVAPHNVGNIFPPT